MFAQRAHCIVPNHPVVLGPRFEETVPRVPSFLLLLRLLPHPIIIIIITITIISIIVIVINMVIIDIIDVIITTIIIIIVIVITHFGTPITRFVVP